MNEFSTYIFKENETKTKNLKVEKERPYYLAVLAFLVAVILLLLDSDYTPYFIMIAVILMLVGKVILSGRTPSVGYRPVTLRLTPNAIFIGKEKLEINKDDVKITLVGYRGEDVQRQAIYQTHSGNDNRMSIKYLDAVTTIRFVLESKTHKDQLIRYCKANGFEISGMKTLATLLKDIFTTDGNARMVPPRNG